ncbi:MAG TPA: LptE family protein, partial [bacterium]|nr:LptE family protein [bacterium]
MKRIQSVLLPLFLFFSGCASYEVVSVLPDYIKNIHIRTFVNQTVFYGIEQKLNQELINRFMNEGRLGVTDSDHSDAVLEGEIIQYRVEPLRYDANEVVQEYKLSIDIDFTFKGKDGQILY